MKTPFKYHAFLAHCSADKTEVELIAKKLEDEANLRVFFDKWNIIPGRLSVEEIEKALSQSNSCVVFIGKDGIGPWQNYERQAALIKQSEERNFHVIPVFLPDFDQGERPPLPNFLALLCHVHFSKQIDFQDSFGNLVAGILGIPPGRDPKKILPKSSLYVKKPIRDLIINKLFQESIDISEIWGRNRNLTVNFLKKKCSALFPEKNIETVESLLSQARSEAYNEKYSNRTKEQDERHIDFGGWAAEFETLLYKLGVENYHKIKAINVGIGNGTECPPFYNSFKELTGVDISDSSLISANNIFPKMSAVKEDAENLKSVPSLSQDLYISLRTYQSTLFDLQEAVFEAYRVLRPKGVCVISVSDAHKTTLGIVRGILASGQTEVDLDLPYLLIDRIRKQFAQLDFDYLGIYTGKFEIYVYGKKR